MAGGMENGKRRELGWSRVVRELCGAYVVTLGTEGMLAGGCTSCCWGFTLVQLLPGCTRWLTAIPAGPREISAGEHGRGAGSWVWVRNQGRVGSLEIPLLGLFLPIPCHPGAEGAQCPGSQSHPACFCVVLGSGCRLGLPLPSLPAQAILPMVPPCTATPAAPRVPAAPHHTGLLQGH